jgi:hypothetical protein
MRNEFALQSQSAYGPDFARLYLHPEWVSRQVGRRTAAAGSCLANGRATLRRGTNSEDFRGMPTVEVVFEALPAHS